MAMRYADGPGTEVEVRVEAPPAAVWPLLCDINLPARHSDEFLGAEWLEGEGLRLGARFRGRNRHPAIGEWETVATVVELVPERRFAWATVDPAEPGATWTFELEPDGAGSRLRLRVRLGPGWTYLRDAVRARPDREERIIERRLAELRRNMQATVTGVRDAAEAAAGVVGGEGASEG